MKKILYAIQGTGNGHLCRALDIIPILQKKVGVDVLISGIQADVEIPFEVSYRFKGMSFIFGKKGGVDIWETFKRLDPINLIREIRSLPVQNYDLVINDFEPVSAWASKFKKIPCISLSHQSAVLNPKAPRPLKSDFFGKFILKNYAPALYKYGFHFEEYDQNIFTPVIRQQIRLGQEKNNGHYTVYLPAYGDDLIIDHLTKIKGVLWEVFSKHSQKTFRKENVFITPVNNERFINSLISSEGVLCGAGFETPAEALFLGKKLMVMPMKGQYEQQCNAAALKKMGVPVINGIEEIISHQGWFSGNDRVLVNYPDQTEQLVNKILDIHLFGKTNQG